MFCTKCGNQIGEGERFCTACGAPVEDLEASQDAVEYVTDPTAVGYADETSPYAATSEQPVAAYTPVQYVTVQPSPPQKKGKNTVLIAILAVLAVAVVAGAIFLGVNYFSDGSQKTATSTSTSTGNSGSTTSTNATSSNSGTSSSNSSSKTTTTTTTNTTNTTTSQNATLPSSNPYSSITADYVIADSNSRQLSESDLSGLTNAQLNIARNEIFARHGRTFKDSNYDAYFRSRHWYSATVSADTFDSSPSSYGVSALEEKNADLIKSYEQSHNMSLTL